MKSCGSSGCKNVFVLPPTNDLDPVTINFNGSYTYNLNIVYEEKNDLFASCGAVLRNEMYLLGGFFEDQVNKLYYIITYILQFWFFLYKSNKFSKLDQCEVKSLGKLPFEFKSGACGTYFISSEKILACFSNKFERVCHR